MSRTLKILCLLFAASTSAGCAVWPIYDPGKVNLVKYNHLTIMPFDANPGAQEKFTSWRNNVLCNKIAEHVKRCPAGFCEVGDKPVGSDKELVLIGLGPAHFHLNVRLKDGKTGEVLSESVTTHPLRV